ncbi:hypothetical protein [uncultured Tateyamaria sp.]|nr:hypothetical protein [uncultured Tateyamaria sp.]
MGSIDAPGNTAARNQINKIIINDSCRQELVGCVAVAKAQHDQITRVA